MKYKKVVISSVAGLALAVSLTACHSAQTSNGQANESKQQAHDTTNLFSNQPIPGFNYSQMRQNLIEIETAEADGVQTTSFFFTANGTAPIDSCPSIGVPIPNTASLSNPSQITWGANNAGPAVTDQMDPNGVYAPTSSEGTFVMCIDSDGKTDPHYWEGVVDTVFAPAVWDDTTKSIKVTGAPSMNFSSHKN